nr:unnamed protein product [Naegleria fowleri]
MYTSVTPSSSFSSTSLSAHHPKQASSSSSGLEICCVGGSCFSLLMQNQPSLHLHHPQQQQPHDCNDECESSSSSTRTFPNSCSSSLNEAKCTGCGGHCGMSGSSCCCGRDDHHQPHLSESSLFHNNHKCQSCHTCNPEEQHHPQIQPHHQNSSLFIVSSSSSKSPIHHSCSISCQCLNCKGSSPSSPSIHASISASTVVVQESHHYHHAQHGQSEANGGSERNDQLTPNLINLLTLSNSTTSTTTTVASSCSCSDKKCADATITTTTEKPYMTEVLPPRVVPNTSLDTNTANYFKIVFGTRLKKAESNESTHSATAVSKSKCGGSCGCSSDAKGIDAQSDPIECSCDPEQPCPIRDSILLKQEKSGCGGNCGGCNYSLGQSARAAAVVSIASNLPSRSAQGKCEGSVKIQKQSVMQSKLKKHLTRIRASTNTGSDSSLPPQCL